jgi:alkanesulfonate monooxygenase SsuD/methylene tetrahydromethanopterin reductase-like flavin-dependent oxidoreductase (luciferase family)
LIIEPPPARRIDGTTDFSGGRFVLGAASGWMSDEFDVLNLPFARRGRVTDDYLAILTTLLRGDEAYSGEWFSHPESFMEPKPARPVPVVAVEGRSTR